MKTKRNLWPYGIILTFIVFISGMAGVVTIAATHQEDLVNDHYYDQELQFQSQIDDSARARADGATIRYDVDAGKIVVKVPIAMVTPKFSGTIECYRPSTPKLDREFLLEPGSDGTQTLNVSQLAVGPWTLHVKWNTGGHGYYLEKKFVVPAK